MFTDPHKVPPGAILVSSEIELKLQDSIRQILKDSPSTVSQEAGFIPSGTVPDYKYMIAVVDRVRGDEDSDNSSNSAGDLAEAKNWRKAPLSIAPSKLP